MSNGSVSRISDLELRLKYPNFIELLQKKMDCVKVRPIVEFPCLY